MKVFENINKTNIKRDCYKPISVYTVPLLKYMKLIQIRVIAENLHRRNRDDVEESF